MSQDITNWEILKELREHRASTDSRFTSIDARFESIDTRFASIDARFNTIDERFKSIDARFNTVDERFKSIDDRFEEMMGAIHAFAEATDKRFILVESELGIIKSQMVTKDYLDRKLWDMQGDMVAMMDRRIAKHEEQYHTTA